ncbi:putative phosphoesterase or phosphohydrolase [Acidovorax sp. CF316]|uniref:metallophosphoesterase n=1 Tax=Acidovorax sp. CF316 TaxID=1144317 RepID=UPI00026BD2CE|nr:metallophosphoesterase [Acidovorax sp. CF316]EJE54409.1 putative phosphoesterase or phosphohydrolase [Acidovorax sp. CF316]
MQFTETLDLFICTLATERDRPDVHATMLALADPDTITAVSVQIQQSLARGERVWLTADLHLNHANVIQYCNRPFADAATMNEYLVAQTRKVRDDEWLVIVGDVAMGDHDAAMTWVRRIPGRKVLVLGNHDLTRAGKCRYLNERAEDRRRPLFEAVVPFLAWQDTLGQNVFVSHYPASVDYPLPRILNYHGHLHRQVLPHTESAHFVNVGWDVTQGLVCL